LIYNNQIYFIDGVAMNIYFACSITGGRADERVYQQIVASLQADGHEVPTALLATSDVIQLEVIVDPIDVYTRDTNWINACDLLIAEVSTPSHGVGYEIAFALKQNKPVLCLHRKGRTVSKMITGNRDPHLTVLDYANESELIEKLQGYLGNWGEIRT
jgi:nucleoside 2-deoxyribosyltransferase